MAKIDIDSLDEAALMELHDQIADRLHSCIGRRPRKRCSGSRLAAV